MAAHSTVDRMGHFRIAVEPGRYTVSAAVRIAHPDISCNPQHDVMVGGGGPVNVDVHCTSNAG
jgi:hypothetical protein